MDTVSFFINMVKNPTRSVNALPELRSRREARLERLIGLAILKPTYFLGQRIAFTFLLVNQPANLSSVGHTLDEPVKESTGNRFITMISIL